MSSLKSSHRTLKGWRRDDLAIFADERTRAGGPLGTDMVYSQLASALCNRKGEGNQRGRVQRERSTTQPRRRCVSLGSVIKLSVGRRGLNALQKERGRDVQPCMRLLTTSYFHRYEWGPHTDSPHCCQTIRAKTFHNMSSTQCSEKSLSWVCTERKPEGGQGLSSGCESFRELWKKRDE